MTDEERRLVNRDKMRRWRSNPENVKKQDKRRKELRDANIEETRRKAHEYYLKNREHILKRSSEYNNKNPQVKNKSNEKMRQLGKGIERGKKGRQNLSTGYVAAQIRKGKKNKSIEQKGTEILIYRLKRIIEKTTV